MSSIAIC